MLCSDVPALTRLTEVQAFDPVHELQAMYLRVAIGGFVTRVSVGYTSHMSMPILATKPNKPVLRPGSVLRPRLIEYLNTGLYSKLTLIATAAGFSKTTLVAEWISSGDHVTARLSLDETDNEPGPLPDLLCRGVGDHCPPDWRRHTERFQRIADTSSLP